MKNKTLRWIAVLPASLLASVLAHIIGGLYILINSGGYSWYTGCNTMGIVEVSLFIMQNILTGAAFVATAWYIAPNHKNTVKTVFATLVSMLCIISITLAIIAHTAEWHTFLSAFTTMGGAIYTAYSLKEEI